MKPVKHRAALAAGVLLSCLVGCGRASIVVGSGAGTAGHGVTGGAGAGGSLGGSGGANASGGAAGVSPFTQVDPQVSRLWRWQSCGSIPPTKVNAVQAIFPPTSTALVVLYDDGSEALYPRDDSAPRQLRAAGNPPQSIAFSPDGTTLAEVAAGMVRVRDVATGAPIADMKTNSACTGNAVRFSAEGDHLLAWDQKSLCVWQTTDGTLVTQLAGNFSSAGMRNGRLLTAELGSPPVVKNWAVSGLEYSKVPLEVPAGASLASAQTGLDGVVVSPRADRLAGRTVNPDLTDELWAADGSLLASLPAGVSLANHWVQPPIVYSESGALVLFGNEVVDVVSQQHWTNTALDEFSPTSIDDTGMQVASISDANQLVAATRMENGAPAARRVFGSLPAPSPTGPSSTPSVLSVSPDGSRLAAGTTSLAMLWRVAPSFDASESIRVIDQGIPLEASFSSSSGEVAFSGDWWGIFSAADGAPLDSPAPPPGIPAGGCSFALTRFSADGQRLAVGGFSPVVAILSRSGLQPEASLPTARCIERASFNGDASLAALSGPELYRTSDWSLVWPTQIVSMAPPAAGADVFRDVQFAPGEKTLLVSGCDGPSFGTGCSHAIYSVADGALLQTLPGLTATHARFSPEGNWIVSGGTVLHVPTSEPVVFDASATLSTFAPNGDIIAILNDNTLARYCRAP